MSEYHIYKYGIRSMDSQKRDSINKEHSYEQELDAVSEHSRLTVQEAGRLGGRTTLERHGVEHYREAGKKGQAKLVERFDLTQRSVWGSMGGRPRKKRFNSHGGGKQSK